jgi:hypothetical protein
MANSFYLAAFFNLADEKKSNVVNYRSWSGKDFSLAGISRQGKNYVL